MRINFYIIITFCILMSSCGKKSSLNEYTNIKIEKTQS